MSQFMLGLLLSVPVAIIANLVTPWFQRRLSARSERSAAKRAGRDAAFEERAKTFAERSGELQEFLLTQPIRITLLGAMVALGLVMMISSSIWQPAADANNLGLRPFFGSFGFLIVVVGYFVALTGTLMMANGAGEALTTYRRAVALRSEVAGSTPPETDQVERAEG